MLDNPILWGCVAAVVSSAVQSLGITLQRKSHIMPYSHHLSNDSDVHSCRYDNAPLEIEPSRNTHNDRRNLWLVGFMLFIVSNVIGSLVQLCALPLIVLSPLQSIGLIFNSVLSCALLPGETYSKRLAGGTLAIAVGAFAIAYNGTSISTPLPELGVDELFRLMIKKFLQPGFITWWSFTFFCMAILMRINWSISRRINSFHDKSGARSINISKIGRDPTSRLVFGKGIIYGLISGTLTAHTFLMAKSIVDVALELFTKRSAPKNVATYITIVIFSLITLCIVGLQLSAFNLGLSNISTAILYPLCFLVYNLINLFNDLSFNKLLSSGKVSTFQLISVLAGLSGVLYGVVLISWDNACASPGVEFGESQRLFTAKFPYVLDTRNRGLSYEESEILNCFCSHRGTFIDRGQ